MKIKNFIARHKIAVSVAAGAVTGVLVRKLERKTRNVADELVELYVTPQQVAMMVYEGGGHVRFDTPSGQVNVMIKDD